MLIVVKICCHKYLTVLNLLSSLNVVFRTGQLLLICYYCVVYNTIKGGGTSHFLNDPVMWWALLPSLVPGNTLLIYTEFLGLRFQYTSLQFSAQWPGVDLLNAPKTFQACKAIFTSSISKNREVHIPETTCMKRNSVHVKNIWITQVSKV